MSDVLHVGSAVMDWLRDQCTYPAENPLPAGQARMFGIPVVLDNHLHPGQWELRDGGIVKKRGQVCQPYLPLAYEPGKGFLTWEITKAGPEIPVQPPDDWPPLVSTVGL